MRLPTLPNSSLKSLARNCTYFIIRSVCRHKTIPYNWNPESQRLEVTTTCGNVRFYSVTGIMIWISSFLTFRLIQSMLKDSDPGYHVPPRIRLMHMIYCLSYTLTIVCKVQLVTRREAIMAIVNALLDEVDRQLQQANTNTSSGDKCWDWVSITLIASTLLAIGNPPAHAVIIFDMPCAPIYGSSLILPCTWIGDRPVSFIAIIPNFLWEVCCGVDLLLLWAFHWVSIFLGLAWINKKVKQMDAELEDTDTMVEVGKYVEYRKIQLITIWLNDAFKLYLQCFPSLLFVIAGVLFFATIRFTHLPLYIYLMFPVCYVRCIFEAVSQLELAGRVNLASEAYLQKIDMQVKRLTETGRHSSTIHEMRTIRKSCKELKCTSGSLYTLEKTIVLVSLSNCAELIVNLLVTYPKAEEGNWGNGL